MELPPPIPKSAAMDSYMHTIGVWENDCDDPDCLACGDEQTPDVAPDYLAPLCLAKES